METNDDTVDVIKTTDARQKFEQERMSRRTALRKLGLTSGFALFGMFAIDDLARVAVKKLAEHKETKAIADSIAHDFKDMGVAFADDGDDGQYYDGGPCILIFTTAPSCKDGRKKKHKICDGDALWADCKNNPEPGQGQLTCCQDRCSQNCSSIGGHTTICTDRCSEIAQQLSA